MLYLLFSNLVEQFSFLNVFKYLTVRTGLSMFTAMLVVFLVSPLPLGIFYLEKKLIPNLSTISKLFSIAKDASMLFT